MKKIISLLICFTILFSVSLPALCAEAESEEVKEVLLIIKERIPSTEKYDKFTSTFSENYGVKEYSLRWSNKDGYLNIQASKSGVILSYYESENNKKPYNQKPTINKMSTEEALDKTRRLLEKINPDIINDLKLYSEDYESLYDNGFSFRIQRVYQGVDVLGDTGYIRVNKDATKIESFNLKYTENLQFDDLSKMIDRNTAIEKYKTEIGMVLSYETKDDKAVLRYNPKYSDKYISAITGEAIKPITPEYELFRNEASMDKVTSAGGGGGSSLTEAELKNLEKVNNLISIKDAEALVRNNKLFNIKESAKLEYYYTNYNSAKNKYHYSLDFSDKDFSATVYMDAQTGEILSFNRYLYDKGEEHKENISLAKSYVQQLASKHYSADDLKTYRFDI